MPSRRINGKSRQSATSAYQPTQSFARPSAGNTALTPSPPSPTAPSSSPRRKGGDYVRRPMNPFMLFRSHVYRNGLISKKHQGDLSTAVAKMWNALSEEEKAPWKAEADRVKQEHLERYPGYTFTPGKKMSPNEAMVAKPELATVGKAHGAARGGASATTSRSKPPARSLSARTKTATRAATPAITDPLAVKSTDTTDQLEIFYDDGSQNDVPDGDMMPLTPNLTDHGAYHPVLHPNDPMYDRDLDFVGEDTFMPTFSSCFDDSLDTQVANSHADANVVLFPASTFEYDLCEQASIDDSDDNDGEQWRKMLAEYIVGYDI